MSNPLIAGVVYEREAPIRDVMRAFVQELKSAKTNVHGILQEIPKDMDPTNAGCGVDAIDIKTGKHVALVRPTQYELDNSVCSMDLSRLAEASMILRRALDDQAEIVVVEKFGKHEKEGGGLSGDLMAVISEGIPTMVTVPKIELESWQRFTGGLSTNLTCDIDQVLAWWKALKA